MSRILRAAPAVVGGRRIEAAVHGAAQRAREIGEAAEARARALVSAAEAERDAVRAAAFDEGRREGMGAAAAALAGAAAARERLLSGAEAEVVALALEVARKVLGRELAQRPDAVVDLAARGLAAVRDRIAVSLRVHPDDLPALRDAQGRLAAILSRAPGLGIREDAALARGSAVIETEAGRVDASVEAQLDALAQALAGVEA